MTPIRCGPRQLAPAGLRTEQECVKDMLIGGQIEPSDSPWASPVVLVTKKDGSTRFCVDYRRLNSLTTKDAYPLPRIDDSLRLLGVYLDDVISFGKSIPEALAHLEEVLARLSDFGLQLKAKKCTFMQTEVGFLGHIVGRTGLACDPEKLSAVRNWHEPNRVKAVCQFVGFVGYYRRFVNIFAAELAEPLVALTRKGAPFVWTDQQQTAFDALHSCLLSAPILGFPTGEGTIRIGYRRQSVCRRGVLNQIQNEEEVVIGYASRSLRISQRRYCTTRWEMLAAVVMCTHFRSYLRGCQFALRTDHSSLRWLQKFKNEDGMLACWYLLLGQFSVTFEYRPGSQHTNADGMSRQCGQCRRADCPVSAADLPATDVETQS